MYVFVSSTFVCDASACICRYMPTMIVEDRAHYIYYSLSYSFEIGSPTQPGDGLAGDLQDLVVFLHSAGAAGVFLAMLVFYKHVGI